jgi:DNA repair exonuclease SbcCD ATPase subunit
MQIRTSSALRPINRLPFNPSQSPHKSPSPIGTAALDLIRDQNNQLTDLKDQYLRLQDQFEREKKEAPAKLIQLQRELRAEERKLAEVEEEVSAKTQKEGRGIGSMEVIEKIWRILVKYREKVREVKEEKERRERIESAAFQTRNETWFAAKAAFPGRSVGS